MEKFMGGIPKNLRFKQRLYIIDNFIFRLYYRYTVSVLVVAMLLISFTELSGEHIKCVINEDDEQMSTTNFMNRYCYLMTTFTVKKYLNSTLLDDGEIPHPGVGAIGAGVMKEDEITRHAYYQWVFFFFLMKVFLFYTPHLIWKNQEGGRIKALTAGLRNAVYATNEAEDREISGQIYPTKTSVHKQFHIITTYLRNHLRITRHWGLGLISFEVLNLIVLIYNIWLTNVFLGYQFLSLGTEVVRGGLDSSVDILDVVFPKMTKCTFHKYGPSGTIQPLDAICVMALNIFNEKTFVFLWFWYIVLFIATGACIIWRLISMCFYRNSRSFNKLVFSRANSDLDIGQLAELTHNYSYLDWLFLVYLAKNMGDVVFRKFFQNLANEQSTILIDIDTDSVEEKTLLHDKLFNENIFNMEDEKIK